MLCDSPIHIYLEILCACNEKISIELPFQTYFIYLINTSQNKNQTSTFTPCKLQ